MSISVSKLWGNRKFSQLTSQSKLLYIYLATHPSLNYAGVVCQEPDEVAKVLRCSVEELRESTKELRDTEYIYVIKDDTLYWIVPSHFSTIGNSDGIIEKFKSDLKSLPSKVVDFLEEIGVSSSKKRKKFDKPTVEDIEEYAISQGYVVDGNTFYNFYQDQPKSTEHLWYDGRGKLVMDWKSKLRKVWFKDTNKLKSVEGYPSEEFKYFYINYNGKFVYPDSWSNGKPKSKDFLINKELNKKFSDYGS